VVAGPLVSSDTESTGGLLFDATGSGIEDVYVLNKRGPNELFRRVDNCGELIQLGFQISAVVTESTLLTHYTHMVAGDDRDGILRGQGATCSEGLSQLGSDGCNMQLSSLRAQGQRVGLSMSPT
jgi:hypothetical protein